MSTNDNKREIGLLAAAAFLVFVKASQISEEKFGVGYSFTDMTSVILHDYPIPFPGQGDLRMHFETRRICTELLSANQNSFQLAAKQVNQNPDYLRRVCEGMQKRTLTSSSASDVYLAARRL